MKKLMLVLTACWGIIGGSQAQSPKETGLKAITKDAVKGQLEFLSSDLMEGRATATRGEYLAADYIASMFRVYGIQPYGDRESTRGGRGGMPFRRSNSGSNSALPRTYYQNMNMIEYGPGADQELSVISKGLTGESSVQFNYRTDYIVRTGTVGRTALAPVVFAGYGLTDEKNGYDDYRKLDVRGKVVLILSGFPGYKEPNSGAYKKFRPEGRFAEYSVERGKTGHAQKLGAAAVIQVRQGEDPSGDWATNQIYNVKGPYYESDVPLSTGDKRMTLMEDTVESSVPVFTISKRVLGQLLEGTGVDLASFDRVAAEKMIPASTVLNGKFLQFKVSVESRIVRSRNVLGYIEGEKKNEVVIIGGHYDHLGKVNGWIFNGADDNASGTVGVLTIAKALAASGKKPEKTIVFAAWSGEEKGLLGSHYFVNHKPDSLHVAVYLNYDMISRNEETDSLGNQAQMNYTEAYPGLKDLTVKTIQDNNIRLKMTYLSSKVPGGGSDHAPFASAGIPIFYFEAAMHPDYHQPSDEVSRVNWDKLTDIIRAGYLDIWELANGNSYLRPVPEK